MRDTSSLSHPVMFLQSCFTRNIEHTMILICSSSIFFFSWMRHFLKEFIWLAQRSHTAGKRRTLKYNGSWRKFELVLTVDAWGPWTSKNSVGRVKEIAQNILFIYSGHRRCEWNCGYRQEEAKLLANKIDLRFDCRTWVSSSTKEPIKEWDISSWSQISPLFSGLMGISLVIHAVECWFWSCMHQDYWQFVITDAFSRNRSEKRLNQIYLINTILR